MRYIFGAFVVWILVRKRLSVYQELVTTNASSAAPKGDRVAPTAN